MTDECCEQPELERRQSELVPAELRSTLLEVHGQQRVRIYVWRLRLSLLCTPEKRVDSGEQFLSPERLRQVIIGTGPEASYLVRLRGLRRQHQHRNVADLSDPLEHLPA